MIEHAAGDGAWGEALELNGAVRLWKELLAEALTDRGTPADDDVVEFMVGYLDPQASWKVVATEMAHSFPGASVRLNEMLSQLAGFLDNMAARERLLGYVEDVLARLSLSVRGQPVGEGLREGLEELNHAADLLARLRVGRTPDRPGWADAAAKSGLAADTRPL